MDIEEDVVLALVGEEDRVQEGEILVVEDEVEELGLAMLVTTHWHVIDAGCVAIWPATVPRMQRHREVAFLALSAVKLLNPCKKAQEDEEEEVALYASVA